MIFKVYFAIIKITKKIKYFSKKASIFIASIKMFHVKHFDGSYENTGFF